MGFAPNSISPFKLLTLRVSAQLDSALSGSALCLCDFSNMALSHLFVFFYDPLWLVYFFLFVIHPEQIKI